MSTDAVTGNNVEEKAEGEGAPAVDDRTASVLSILPVQDAPYTGHKNLAVKRGPGRPRKVERMPTVNDLQYHATMAEEKSKFIATDPVVQAIEQKRSPVEVLFEVKKGVATEAAAMAFDRIENEKRGRTSETVAISGRRIEALKKIAEIELKLKELEQEKVNLSSPTFQRIFAFWVEKIREVAAETLPSETLDLFFNRFATAMEKWEEEAANLVR